ncbi:hypothetical protein [Helicobacter sp. T3_23-1056]
MLHYVGNALSIGYLEKSYTKIKYASQNKNIKSPHKSKSKAQIQNLKSNAINRF